VRTAVLDQKSGFSPGYRHALPPPPRGGGGGARSAGGVGGCEYRYVVRQGRRASPPPRQPLPRGDSRHGPLHRDRPEKNRVQSHTQARISPEYPHALPPPPRGRGRSAKRGRGGGYESRYPVRQGSPPPRQPPPPEAISTTVRYTGTSPGNSSPEPHPGARLLPPGIPTHCPAPPKLTPVLPAGLRPGWPPRSPPGRPGSSA
jgi:hypothetical protein